MIECLNSDHVLSSKEKEAIALRVTYSVVVRYWNAADYSGLLQRFRTQQSAVDDLVLQRRQEQSHFHKTNHSTLSPIRSPGQLFASISSLLAYVLSKTKRRKV